MSVSRFTGIDSGFGEKFVNTGYGTYSGAGNAKTGSEDMKGTGYDEHGQVKTQFGKWPISYDPTGLGTASAGMTTSIYDFPPEGHRPPAGLTDISIPAEGHTTMEPKRGEEEVGKQHPEAEAGHGDGSGGGGSGGRGS